MTVYKTVYNAKGISHIVTNQQRIITQLCSSPQTTEHLNIFSLTVLVLARHKLTHLVSVWSLSSALCSAVEEWQTHKRHQCCVYRMFHRPQEVKYVNQCSLKGNVVFTCLQCNAMQQCTMYVFKVALYYGFTSTPAGALKLCRLPRLFLHFWFSVILGHVPLLRKHCCTGMQDGLSAAHNVPVSSACVFCCRSRMCLWALCAGSEECTAWAYGYDRYAHREQWARAQAHTQTHAKG